MSKEIKVKLEYPRMMFHKSEDARIAADEAAEKELRGLGYGRHAEIFGQAVKSEPKKAEDSKEVKAEKAEPKSDSKKSESKKDK